MGDHTFHAGVAARSTRGLSVRGLIGFLLGGAIAALSGPRLSYAVAGAGVLIVLVLATARLRNADWDAELEQGSLQDGLQDDASSVAEAGPPRSVLTGP